MGNKITKSQVVVSKFVDFLDSYNEFRKKNNLPNTISNIHEICTSMTDKHGRICRQIKHKERNDKKEDWPEALTEALSGYIVYAIMLLNYYEIDISEGMEKEFLSSVKQHSRKN